MCATTHFYEKHCRCCRRSRGVRNENQAYVRRESEHIVTQYRCTFFASSKGPSASWNLLTVRMSYHRKASVQQSMLQEALNHTWSSGRRPRSNLGPSTSWRIPAHAHSKVQILRSLCALKHNVTTCTDVRYDSTRDDPAASSGRCTDVLKSFRQSQPWRRACEV